MIVDQDPNNIINIIRKIKIIMMSIMKTNIMNSKVMKISDPDKGNNTDHKDNKITDSKKKRILITNKILNSNKILASNKILINKNKILVIDNKINIISANSLKLSIINKILNTM